MSQFCCEMKQIVTLMLVGDGVGFSWICLLCGTVGERPGCSVLPEGSECACDGTREVSEKLLTFSGMGFLELDNPGTSHLQFCELGFLKQSA